MAATREPGGTERALGAGAVVATAVVLGNNAMVNGRLYPNNVPISRYITRKIRDTYHLHHFKIEILWQKSNVVGISAYC